MYSVSSCRLTHDGGIAGIHEQVCVTDLKALGLSSKSLQLNENHSMHYENKVPKLPFSFQYKPIYRISSI